MKVFSHFCLGKRMDIASTCLYRLRIHQAGRKADSSELDTFNASQNNWPIIKHLAFDSANVGRQCMHSWLNALEMTVDSRANRVQRLSR
jgi:hypothetical protein